jgi:hypothetical protein
MSAQKAASVAARWADPDAGDEELIIVEAIIAVR